MNTHTRRVILVLFLYALAFANYLLAHVMGYYVFTLFPVWVVIGITGVAWRNDYPIRQAWRNVLGVFRIHV